ncbi:MAG TPA: T9SS type A sorting domain-containing protein [Flavobacteriaceae bacterium]|nr:T9SS type A sorting domain-containing protein [Flavobacteriaceae bacterium]
MKQLYLFFLIVLTFTYSSAQIINIPDANFKNALVNTLCVDTNNDGIQDDDVDTNNDGEIQISEAEAITSLNVSGKSIYYLDGIESFINLDTLNIRLNRIETLDISNLIGLKSLFCERNYLSSLDVSFLSNLETLNCYQNQLTSINLNSTNSLLYLDLGGNPDLSINSFLQSNMVNLTNLKTLKCSSSGLTNLDFSILINLEELDLYNNLLTTLDVSNLTKLKVLTCQNNQLTSLNVSNLVDLENLTCSQNLIYDLDIGELTKITRLICNNNELTDLNISSLINLDFLNIDDNKLVNLNIENLSNLKTLLCNNNLLSSLNVENLNKLQTFKCSFNNLVSLDISGLQEIQALYCNDNELSSLIVGTSITLIRCYNNKLSSLDLTNAFILDHLECNNNELSTLFIKNGTNETTFNDTQITIDFENNPNLQYICADEFEIGTVQSLIDNYGYSSCEVNSYCTFTPAGESFTIQGTNNINQNGGNCDVAIPFYNNVKYVVNSTNINGQFISNSSGNYKTSVTEGDYILTPLLENPSYFTISPSSITVSFPEDGNAYVQDFCITPNGEHNDLDVSIIPTNTARPGFDSNYKVIYKNKGSITLSGTLQLDFNDDLMDFVSSTPNIHSQNTGGLTWNFTDLLPFESKVVEFTMNLKTPTDPSFPLNGGDLLIFTATVSPTSADEIPEDNVFVLNQTVVNSLDPNDKTCLEGNAITEDLIGEYVHYLIRCENTGSAEAVNIVIKDVIDTTKFDLSTLFISDSSHSMETRINDDVVEFIFEDINLPFDDANNDAYVAFKIKTLATLMVGDTFENDAEIYFDYNAPIMTNNYSTSIENSLGIHDLNKQNVKVYPNPVKDKFFLDTQENIKYIIIYDVNGRLLSQSTFIGDYTKKDIDVSQLSNGIYFLRLKSDIDKYTLKIIKK